MSNMCETCKLIFDTKRGLSNHMRDGCKTIRHLEYKRNCPICSNTIWYERKCKFTYAVQNNCCCKKCLPKTRIGLKPSNNTKEKISLTLKNLYQTKKLIPNMSGAHSSLSRKKQSITRTGIKLSDEHKAKIGSSVKTSEKYKLAISSDERRKKLSEFRKKFRYTDESKRKMRLSAIKRTKLLNNGQMIPSYNENACKIIDEYGKQNGYNFQHALNGGEYFIEYLGYWVDGYDKEKNMVIEVDEKKHFNRDGSLKEKDLIRQKEIENYLNCGFVRLKNISF